MKNKNFLYSYSNINKKIYVLFFIILFYLNNCLLEIPLTPVKVKGIPKYGNIKVQEPDENSSINIVNNKIFATEGGTTLNANLLFLGNIKVGSSKQSFNLVLDTGSIILWVPIVGSDDQSDSIKNHYDPNLSTTKEYTKEPFEVQYGTGYCKGYYYKDNINYIGNNNFVVKFGAAQTTEFEVDGADGIIGLSHYYSDESLSFIYMLKKYKVIDSTVFSFKFEGSLSVGMSGKLILGKHKDFSSSDAVTCPLINSAKTFWACEVSTFGIKNSYSKIESTQSCNIIFDTGTNIIMLPLAYYNDLRKDINKLGCSFVLTDDRSSYQIKCSYDYLVDFRFKINGNVLIVPSGLTFYKTYNGYLSRVVFNGDYYIIGSPFFLAFHTLFDKENEELHFYPEDISFLEKGSSFGTIIVVIVVISVILIISGYLIYKCIIWRRAKREIYDIPSSNYSVY